MRRIADDDPAEPLAQRVGDLGEPIGGDQHAPDRRALLAGLLGHVADDVGDEQRAGLAGQRDVGREDGGVEAVGLDVEPDAARDDAGCARSMRAVALPPVNATTSPGPS